jgi:hypothetical protein
MRSRISALALALLVLASTAPALAQSNDANVDAAKQAAQEWLALIDANKYEASWSEAASIFTSQVTAEQWAAQVQQAHSQLDSLQSRSLIAARYTESLPNLPKGDYVVTQYRATYGSQKTVETITLTKEQDTWRVAGYFIRPENQNQ